MGTEDPPHAGNVPHFQVPSSDALQTFDEQCLCAETLGNYLESSLPLDMPCEQWLFAPGGKGTEWEPLDIAKSKSDPVVNTRTPYAFKISSIAPDETNTMTKDDVDYRDEFAGHNAILSSHDLAFNMSQSNPALEFDSTFSIDNSVILTNPQLVIPNLTTLPFTSESDFEAKETLVADPCISLRDGPSSITLCPSTRTLPSNGKHGQHRRRGPHECPTCHKIFNQQWDLK